MRRLGLVIAVVCFAPYARADEVGDARREMRTAIAQMDGTANRLRLVLREARAKHLATACFDDALSRADVSLRHAREHARDAEEAFARGDAGRARIEVSQVRAMRETSREASTMADTCAAGKLDFPAPDTTVVKVYVDPRLAK